MVNNKWNKKYTKESHNCYSYFLNKTSKKAKRHCKKLLKKGKKRCPRPQPGYAAGFPNIKKSDYTCKKMIKRTLADNPSIKKTTKKRCPNGYYKGALVVAPKKDYHYYRKHKDKKWSHKMSWTKATTRDVKGKLLKNVKKASRNYKHFGNFNKFCTYFCVPKKTKKNMKLLPKVK